MGPIWSDKLTEVGARLGIRHGHPVIAGPEEAARLARVAEEVRHQAKLNLYLRAA